MAKALKVYYKGVKAEYKDGELKGIIRVEDLENEGGMVETEVNVTTEVKELLATLEEDEMISVNIKKFKETVPKEKKTVYKYHCGCPDNEIKSTFEGLDITCNECQETFMMEEGK